MRLNLTSPIATHALSGLSPNRITIRTHPHLSYASYDMSVPDPRQLTHMLHLLPSPCEDHEAEGALIGRYMIRCSRQPDAVDLPADDARGCLSEVAETLFEGQRKWANILASTGNRLTADNLSSWRSHMMQAAAKPMGLKGSMASATAILLKPHLASTITLAYKMYENEEDFRSLRLRPAHHTVVHEVPRFYQTTSPLADITLYFTSNNREPVVSSELYATSSTWGPCKSALTKALASLREIPSVPSGSSEAQTRDRQHDWRGTIGIEVRHQLLTAEGTQSLIWGPLSRGEISPGGSALVQSIVQKAAERLRTEYPQGLGQLSAYVLRSPEEKFERTTWMKLAHDETLP